MTTRFRARLLAREPLIGTLISLPIPEFAEIAAGAGIDWLFLDMEHGRLDAPSLSGMIQAAGETCPCVVRVPANEDIWIKKAFDAGAAGIIVPHIDTPEQAARAVHWSKFPPEGGRGVGFTRSNRYGAQFQEHVETANSSTAVIAQVEHIDGVRNINEILSVPGVDAVFIGPYDLSASLGKPGSIQDKDVLEAMGSVREACSRKKTAVGIFSDDIPAAKKALADGFSLVCSGIDVSLFSKSVVEITRVLKQPAG